MVLEQLDLGNHMDKVDTHPYIRINSKWVIKHNIKSKTLKFLKEKKGESLRKCSTLLIIWALQIKTTISNYYLPTGVPELREANVWRRISISHVLMVIVKWFIHIGEEFRGLLKS